MDEIMRNLENNSLCQSSRSSRTHKRIAHSLNEAKGKQPPFLGCWIKLNPTLTGVDMHSLR
jgi:hypothetical protein